MSDLTIANDVGKSRYEAHIDGALVGFAEYELTDRLIVFTHTEVKPQLEGNGVGGTLARYALDGVRTDGSRKVMPLCPFIKGWIARHAEYRDLVYGEHPSQPTG